MEQVLDIIYNIKCNDKDFDLSKWWLVDANAPNKS